MKLKITTAFQASKRFSLPLVGLFVLGMTAIAQQMTIQPVAPPVESTTQLAMTNSFQLFNDGKRWWILSVYWQHESADHAIPQKYLKR